MAITLYADGVADAALSRADAQDAPSLDARLRMRRARYTFDGTEAALAEVGLFKLPAGATVVPWLSALQVVVDCATTFTADIGDTDSTAPSPLVDADVDRYADGVDVGAVGYDAFASGAAAARLYTLGEECWITLKFATLVTLVEGGIIDVFVAYLSPSG
jgi:hypothetical protein